jgi:hypothetical protein
MINAKYVFVILLLVFASCDDDNSESKAEDVKQTATSGTWRITYFFDTDKDETDNFDGYTFDFGTGNTLTATKGSVSHTGVWSVTDDSRTDDSIDYKDIDFNISFATPPEFEELSEDWEIVSINDTKIELRHVSGGGGGTDLLNFQKI